MTFLRTLFLRNVGLKLTSLALAFLLWFQIAGQATAQRIVQVPVVFVNMPLGLEITGDFQPTVDVLVRSEAADNTLDQSDFAVVVDMRAAKPGEQVIPLTETNVAQKPAGVEIMSVLTSRIRLKLERIRRRTVEVRAQIVGDPGAGFTVQRVNVNPPTVAVVGPETRLEKVEVVPTGTINIDGVTGTLTRQIYLDMRDPRIRIEGPQDVTVTVIVIPQDQKQTHRKAG